MSETEQNAPSLGSDVTEIVDGASEPIANSPTPFDVHARLAGAIEHRERGRAILLDLDKQRANMARELCRLDGAIQVLEELAASELQKKETP